MPTDGDIVAALVADHRAVRTTPPASPSSFAADCAAILGPGRTAPFSSGRRLSTDSDCSAATPQAPALGRTSTGRASCRFVPGSSPSGPSWIDAKL